MENTKADSKCAGCPFHHWCGGAGNHWVHIVIRIAIAIIIFWAGVQFGELKGTLYGGHEYYMMRGARGDGWNMMYYGGPNMMYGNDGYRVAAPGTQPQPTSTTTKK